MSIGEFGVFIPMVGMTIPIVAIWTKHQRRMAELHLMNGDRGNAEVLTHVKELEERVRVLERIVTDKGHDVAAQIEALRDPAPRIEARIGERAQ